MWVYVSESLQFLPKLIQGFCHATSLLFFLCLLVNFKFICELKCVFIHIWRVVTFTDIYYFMLSLKMAFLSAAVSALMFELICS